MTPVRVALEHALGTGAPVVLDLLDGEHVAGVVERLVLDPPPAVERGASRLDDDDGPLDPMPYVAIGLTGHGGMSDCVDLRRIRSVRRPTR